MNKRKILVVDDETGFTRLMKMAMHRYQIQTVNDPKQALQTARKFHPDLILLDMIMPGLDGCDLAAKMKADPKLKTTPIVFLTAVVSPREAGESPKLIDGYPFLAKPVNPEVLEECIEAQLSNRS